MLINFGPGGTFESVQVFGMILGLSIATTLAAKFYKVEPFKWLDGKFDKDDFKWIGIGVGGILFSVVGISYIIADAIGILIALGLGGMVLAFVLYKSQNLIANVIVHGAYNSIAVLAASGAFQVIGLSAIPLNASPIFIPRFTFEGVNPNDLASQILMQFLVVSLAEEMLKVALSLAVAIFFTRNKIAVFGVSVALWAAMHGILAYKV